LRGKRGGEAKRMAGKDEEGEEKDEPRTPLRTTRERRGGGGRRRRSLARRSGLCVVCRQNEWFYWGRCCVTETAAPLPFKLTSRGRRHSRQKAQTHPDTAPMGESIDSKHEANLGNSCFPTEKSTLLQRLSLEEKHTW
jgi:hypothetical protein